jgi:phenylacetate-CoA ligase
MAIKSDVLLWNSKVETASRRDLQGIQLRRLEETLVRAYHCVPFYRRTFDEFGVSPSTIKSLDDLKKFPFTDKADLRQNYPFGLFAVPQKEVARLHASSGTKGKPTVVAYTKADLQVWAEVVARSLAAAGAKPGDILHNAYGYGLFTGGLGLHCGAETFGTTVVPVSGGRTQQQVLLLQDFGPRILCCTPSYALNIAYTMEELSVPRQNLKLEIGIFGAEPWTEEMRTQLESRLRIHALDIYGLSEVVGPGVSMECLEGKNGLHIWEDHFLPEIVDPATGELLAEGQEGELVFTTLSKQAMPLIRFRTGDLSQLNYERCKCGRTMVRMTRVRARIDDMLIVRGVNVFPSEIEKVLLQLEEVAPHYQLVLERNKALDTLEVQVEITETIVARFGSFDDGQIDLKQLNERITSLLKDSLGLTATVKLMKPNSIPRSEGKAARILDKRGKQS